MSEIASIRLLAFIFHTSRCGSTLFAKALAREPQSLVLVQPGPFQHGFWSATTSGFHEPLEINEQNLDNFRKLLLLMTRPRLQEQQQVFVKFISWNVLYLDFIMSAFPDVPAIFLYRDPAEIIASVRKSTTAILEAKSKKQAEFLTGLPRSDIDRLDAVSYLAICYRRSFETIIASRRHTLSLLDYTDLKSERFGDILARSFGYQPTPSALENMRLQFATHSKDDSGNSSFSDDREAKRQLISESERQLISRETGSAFTKLKRDKRNLFARPPQSSQPARSEGLALTD